MSIFCAHQGRVDTNSQNIFFSNRLVGVAILLQWVMMAVIAWDR